MHASRAERHQDKDLSMLIYRQSKAYASSGDDVKTSINKICVGGGRNGVPRHPS